jgi:hypothetical protein
MPFGRPFQGLSPRTSSLEDRLCLAKDRASGLGNCQRTGDTGSLAVAE